MSTPSNGTPGTHGGTYAGRFSDGRTASASPAAVRLSSQGVEIAASGQAPLVWSYGELAAASPIGGAAGDVLLSCAAMPGATLFVADGVFVATLADRASHLTAASQRWRIAGPLIAVCAAVAMAVAGLWVADVSPARGLAGLLPTQLRQSLGRQVVQSLSQGHSACQTPAGSAALARLSERLSAAAGGKSFSVKVVDWSIINAFAAPGEQIVVARGLIEQARGADEVAGVLAHEMGHGLELHPETAIIRAIGLSAAVELMLGGSGGTLANIGLAEREADARALQILEKAQISPLGFAGFFKRVEERDRGSVIGEISFLRTHPLSAERARLAESRPPYAATPALSEEDWRALREICGSRPAAR
jgi:Zn-dependent protease with chaperone function